MKKYILSLLMLAGLNAGATDGHDQGGGGDICEDRIKIIRDDLRQWIINGGPNALTLPEDTDAEEYSSLMLGQMAITKVRCVSTGDLGHPVQVNGTAKTCRYDSSGGLGHITCDYTKFQALSESDQYVLVHHEFAGLSGLELPNGDDSDYSISNQISGYLEDQIVKKLTVKPSPVSDDEVPFNPKTCDGPPMTKKDFLAYFSAGGAPVKLKQTATMVVRERKCLGSTDDLCTEWKYSKGMYGGPEGFQVSFEFSIEQYDKATVKTWTTSKTNGSNAYGGGDDILRGVLTPNVTSKQYGFSFGFTGYGNKYDFDGVGRLTKNCLVMVSKNSMEEEVGYWVKFAPPQ